MEGRLLVCRGSPLHGARAGSRYFQKERASPIPFWVGPKLRRRALEGALKLLTMFRVCVVHQTVKMEAGIMQAVVRMAPVTKRKIPPVAHCQISSA